MKYSSFLRKVVFAVLLVSCGAVFGQTTYEAQFNGTLYATLAEACAAANTAGGTVVIETLQENITLSSVITFSKASLNVTLTTASGQGFDRTTIKKTHTNNSMFLCSGANSTITVNNLNFDGEDRSTSATVAIQHTQATGNIVITNCEFVNCKRSSSGGGGAVYSAGTVTLTNPSTTDTIKFSNCFANGANNSGGGAILAKWIVINGGLDASSQPQGNQGYIRIENCSSNEDGGAVTGNSGGITAENNEGTISFSNCSTTGSGDEGAAIYVYSCDLLFSNKNNGKIEFVDCTSKGYGGAMCVWSSGKITLIGSENGPVVFKRCTAANGGGAIWINPNSSVSLTNVTFGTKDTPTDACKTTSGDGGAVRSNGSLTYINNSANEIGVYDSKTISGAGGAFSSAGAMTITNSSTGAISFSGTMCTSNGGAIYSGGVLNINNSGGGTVSFTNTSCNSNGGAIYANSTLTLSNCTFGGLTSGNTVDPAKACVAGTHGGAVYANGNVTLKDCKAYGCHTPYDSNSHYGGAVYCNSNSSTMSIQVTSGNNSTFIGNQAGRGGAICAQGILTTSIDATGTLTFEDNTAYDQGGAIWVGKNLTLNGNHGSTNNITFANCSNTSTNGSYPGYGGAIYHYTDTKVTLKNVTITGGSSLNGGAIYSKTKNLELAENINISGNSVRSTDRVNAAGIYLTDEEAIITISGSSGANINVSGNTTSNGLASNVKTGLLVPNFEITASSLTGAIGVANTVASNRWFGRSTVSEVCGANPSTVFSDDAATYTAEYHGADKTRLYWGPVPSGDPVCKITDANGNLLYYGANGIVGSEALFTSLADAFGALQELSRSVFFSDASGNSVTPANVEMLVTAHPQDVVLNVPGVALTLKTASNPAPDDHYPGPGSNCTITRSGFASSMFIMDNGEDFTLENIIIDGNNVTVPDHNGGIIRVESASGKLRLNGGAVLKNGKTSLSGGAVYLVNGALLTMNGAEINGCSAVVNGGGIFLAGTNGNPTIENSTFIGCSTTSTSTSDDNSAGCGGAIYSERAGMTIRACTFSSDTTPKRGGAICFIGSGTLAVYGTSFSNCTSTLTTDNNGLAFGGAIYMNSGALTISSNIVGDTETRSSFSNCTANRFGGAIMTRGSSTHTIEHTDFSSCYATLHKGGVIYKENGGVTTFADCTFTSCHSGTAADSQGGAICMWNTANQAFSITDCTFTGCYSPNANGGAIFSQRPNLIIENTYITGGSAQGGAIGVNSASCKLTFKGSTKVTGNTWNGNTCNVYMNFDTDNIIYADGLADDAEIGVYVSDAYLGRYGKAGRTFGRYTGEPENLDKFVNDRETTLLGVIFANNKIAWPGEPLVLTLLNGSDNATPIANARFELRHKVWDTNVKVWSGITNPAGEVTIPWESGSVPGEDPTIADDADGGGCSFLVGETYILTELNTGTGYARPGGHWDISIDAVNGPTPTAVQVSQHNYTDNITKTSLFQWETHNWPAPLTINFELEGGTWSESTPQTFAFTTTSTQSSEIIPTTIPTKSGYAFAAWSTTATGSGAGTFSFHPGDPVWMPASSPLTLYAVWIDDSYVARVIDNSGNITYHNYLINTGTGVNQGAFTYANTLSGSVTIELLKETHERYSLTSQFTFNKSGQTLTIRTMPGLGFTSTILKNMTASLIKVTNPSSLTVENLVFDGNSSSKTGTEHGGIFSLTCAKATFTDCTFQNSKVGSYSGGAVYMNRSGGRLEVYGCVFDRCISNTYSGGGIYVQNQPNLTMIVDRSDKNEKTQFIDCTAKTYGGGFLFDPYSSGNYSTASISVKHADFIRCKVTNNSGGGFDCATDNLTVVDCIFEDCESTGTSTNSNFGGGFCQRYNSNTTVKIAQCEFRKGTAETSTGCKAVKGGGCYFAGGNVILKDSQFSDCQVNSPTTDNHFGGAVYVANTATIEGCSFTDCGAKKGGGIYSEKAMTMSGGTITGCTAAIGGGIYGNNTVSLTNVTFGGYMTDASGNTILYEVDESGNFVLDEDDNPIPTTDPSGKPIVDPNKGCSATSTTGGGGLYCPNTVTYTNNTAGEIGFYGCTTSGEGGAIYLNGSTMTINNNNSNGTICFKDCESVKDGGAISVQTKTMTINNIGTINFENCESGQDGGGICTDNYTLYINNAANASIKFDGCKSMITDGGTSNGGGIQSVPDFGTSGNLGTVTFTNCSAEGYGGAMYINGNTKLNNVIVKGNTAGNQGGGIYAVESLTLLKGTLVELNSLGNDDVANGGGIYMNNSKTLTIGATDDGESGNDVTVTGNTTSEGDVSDVRLAASGNGNASNSVSILSKMTGFVGVCNPPTTLPATSSQLGTQEVKYYVDENNVSHIFSDLNGMVAVSKQGTEADLKKVVWGGNYVCKITDAEGNLLRFDDSSPRDALFFSVREAFVELNSDNPNHFINGTPKYVKMLCDYFLRNQVFVSATESNFKDIIFTTASTSDEDYPSSVETATLYKGGLGKSMFVMNTPDEKLTLGNITISGKETLGQTTDAGWKASGMFLVNAANAQLIVGGEATLRDINVKSDNSTLQIQNGAKLEIQPGASIDNCHAKVNGGVARVIGSGSTLNMKGGTVQNCGTTYYGGAFYGSSEGAISINPDAGDIARFVNCSVTGSSRYGGAIYVEGDVSVANAIFGGYVTDGDGNPILYEVDENDEFVLDGEGNPIEDPQNGKPMVDSAKGCTASNGGAIYAYTGNVTYTNNTDETIGFYGCRATGGEGGAIFARKNSQADTGVAITINNTEETGNGTIVFERCSATGDGGAVSSQSNQVAVNNKGMILFNHCVANEDGGGICTDGRFLNIDNAENGTIRFAYCQSNHGSEGGGGIQATLKETGDGQLGSVEFSHCTSNYNGGAIYAHNAFDFSGVIIEGCSASHYGGGIYTNSTASLNNWVISGNTANNDRGGGVYANTDITLSGCSVSDNAATQYGGGVFANTNITLKNNTGVTSNILTVATDRTRGAGIYINNSKTLYLGHEDITNEYITVYGNEAANGDDSNVRLAWSNPNNWASAVSVLSDLGDYIGVCNPGPENTQFGTDRVEGDTHREGLEYIISDVDYHQHGGLKAGEPIGNVYWITTSDPGSLICKITDSEGNLLYYDNGSVPATFARLDEAVTAIQEMTEGYFKDGSGNNAIPTHIKMIKDAQRVMCQTTIYSPKRSFTLTTAGRDDADYNYEPENPDAPWPATLYKGLIKSGQRGMLGVNNPQNDVTITFENIILDGRSNANVPVPTVSTSALSGAGAASVSKGASGKAAVIILDDDATLQNFRTTGSGGAVNVSNGGRLEIKPGAAITNCINSGSGGAVSVTGANSTLYVTGGTMEDCISQGSGGAFYISDPATLTIDAASPNTVEFINCSASSNGGAIYISSNELPVTGATFTNCTSSGGGAIYSGGPHIDLTNTTFTNCLSTGSWGGGIWQWRPGAVGDYIKIHNSSFTDCVVKGTSGGGVETDAYYVELKNTAFTRCKAASDGGGLNQYRTGSTLASVENCQFIDCVAGSNGGGFNSRSTIDSYAITIKETTVNGHVDLAAGTCNANNGGGFQFTNGSATLIDVTVSNCTAKGSGGGVYVGGSNGTLTVSGVVKVDNNRKDSATGALNNVYMANSTVSKRTISIAEEGLSCGSHIGVSNNSGNKKVVAQGLGDGGTPSTNCLYAGANRFFFDDSGKFRAYCLDKTDGSTTYTTDKIYFIDSWRNHAANSSGDISVDGDVVTVKSAAGLAFIAKEVNDGNSYEGKTVKLNGDLILNSYLWEPIGEMPGSCPDCEVTAFKGNFDGQGHAIRNLNGYLPHRGMGLFGCVAEGGTVANTIVEGGCLEYTYDDGLSKGEGYLGGLVGDNKGTVHSNYAVTTLTGDAGSVLGGLVGCNEGSLCNSYGRVAMSGSSHIGGLVGTNASGASVENCYAVVGEQTFPAFADNNAGSIQYCYTDKANGYVGGGTGTLTGHGTYGAVLGDIKEIGYMYGDNLVTLDGGGSTAYVPAADAAHTYLDNHIVVWRGLLSALNQWVRAHSGYTPWFRPITTNINGDLPILGFSTNNSVAALDADPNVLTYGSLDALLSANNGKTASVFLYGNATNVANTPSTNVKVFVNEDACLLQADGASDFRNTTVGITFDNSCGGAHAYDGTELKYDWHLMSTPLGNAKIGATYFSVDGSNYVPYSSTYPSSVDINSLTDSYFPNGLPMAAGYDTGVQWDFYSYFEPEYHWINLKRNKKNHFHFEYDRNPGQAGVYQTDDEGHLHYQVNYTGTDQSDTKAASGDDGCFFTPGKGYMMAISQDSYLCSTGTLNRGNVPIKLTKTRQDPDWEGYFDQGCNLIGNPYQAYLDLEKVAKPIGEGGTGYSTFFVYIAEQDYYIPYVKDQSLNTLTPSRYIHPHQAFFVQKEDYGEEDFTFTPDMATTDKEEHSYFRGDHIDYPLVNLFVENENGTRNYAIVEVGRPEAGGAGKSDALETDGFELYARHDQRDYKLLFTPQGEKRIPVFFRTDKDGEFTFTWDTQNGQFKYLRLLDNIAGTECDMLTNDHYTFSGQATDYAARFYLLFEDPNHPGDDPGDDPNGGGEHPFAFYDGNGWIVSGSGLLQVVDVAGRVLHSENLTGETNRVNLDRLAAGVYVLRLTGNQVVKTQKVVINKH